MRAEDLQVQRELIDAGHGARAIECRGSMHETLADILAEDSDRYEDFVDRLRATLSTADRLDRQTELEQVRTEHQDIKACPDCHLKPDLDYVSSDSNEIFVSCMNHDHVVLMGGATLSEAIGHWNRDDWTGFEAVRELFPL